MGADAGASSGDGGCARPLGAPSPMRRLWALWPLLHQQLPPLVSLSVPPFVKSLSLGWGRPAAVSLLAMATMAATAARRHCAVYIHAPAG